MPSVPYSLFFRKRREWRGYFCHCTWKYTPEWLGNFARSFNHAEITSLETFWHTQVWNLKYLSLIIVLFFFFTFTAAIFDNFFPYSINYVIKTKYILLKLKALCPMSAISETYNRGYKILQLVDILPNVSFMTSETERG